MTRCPDCDHPLNPAEALAQAGAAKARVEAVLSGRDGWPPRRAPLIPRLGEAGVASLPLRQSVSAASRRSRADP